MTTSSSSTRSRARILSLAAFTAWLSIKHPRTKVGTAECEDACPLAKFLTQTTGVPHSVDGEQYIPAEMNADGTVVRSENGDIVWDFDRAHNLPQWAQHFVEKVDDNSGSISAMKALRYAESKSLGRAARMSCCCW